MTNILLKIHYNKITENYTCEKSDLLHEHFSNFAKKCQKKEDDFIFLYKGSVVNYINPATNAKIKISDTIFGNSQSKQFNIFAVLITSPPSSKEQKNDNYTEQNEIQSDTASNYRSEGFGDTGETEIRRKINKQYYLDIVCPKCDTTAIIEKVQDKNSLLLNVLNCSNFHYLKNIHYDAFDDFMFGCEKKNDKKENDKDKEGDQKVDIRDILNFSEKYKCDYCSINKKDLTPPEDDIVICSCGSQFCPRCLIVHKMEFKEHKFTINVDDKNYLCLEHGEKFVAYCLDCNANVCDKCRNEHKDTNSHEIIEFNTIRVSKEKVNDYTKDVDDQKEILIDFTETLRCLFDDILYTIENYINSYIMIERGLIRRFKLGNHNYQLLKNLKNKNLFEIDIIKEMKKLNEDYENYRKEIEEGKNTKININDLFSTLLKQIYDPINKSKQVEEPTVPSSNRTINKNPAIINYVMENTSNKRNIKLFDPAFVKNNKKKLNMKITADFNEKDAKNQMVKKTGQQIYTGDLIAFYNNKGSVEYQKMKIELTEKDNQHVVDMSYMLNNCKYFSDADFSRWDLNDIISMEAIFQLCKIKKLDNIKSIFNNDKNKNLSNIRAMFCKCSNLTFDQDADKWFFKLNNDTKLKNMSMLFSGCKNMEGINLNSWRNYKFNHLEDISYMFNRCTKLKVVDNFKRFNTTKVKNMCGLFNRCESLKTLSNFTLITQSVENTSIMFQGCKLLDRIDNGFYDAKFLKDASGMFANCPRLNSIKNIIYYNSDNLENVTALFKNCKALTAPPDYMFQKWSWGHVKKVNEMFAGCDRFTSAPRWLTNMRFDKSTNLDDLFKDCKLENKDKVISDLKAKQIDKNSIN